MQCASIVKSAGSSLIFLERMFAVPAQLIWLNCVKTIKNLSLNSVELDSR
jgi:hypothetical protein